MRPDRISLKFFVNDPAAVDFDAFIPLFHDWIQNNKVEGLLIDVADYKHVPNGPGIMLIGHESDYSMDNAEGRPGLMYTRKREMPDDLADVLRLTFRLALTACKILEAEPRVNGKITFSTAHADLIFFDRLHTPNNAETFEAVHSTIATILKEVYSAEAQIERAQNDPREPLTIKISAPETPLATLVGRLEANGAKSAV
jgi:hypothetical protein